MTWTGDDVALVLQNPFSAVNSFYDGYFDNDNPPCVTPDQWVAEQVKQVEEIGLELWLRRLLVILECGDPAFLEAAGEE